VDVHVARVLHSVCGHRVGHAAHRCVIYSASKLVPTVPAHWRRARQCVVRHLVQRGKRPPFRIRAFSGRNAVRRHFNYRRVGSPQASLTAQFPVKSDAMLWLPDDDKSTAKNPKRVFMAAAAYNKSISSNRIFIHFIWVWLLFGNELPPLHRLKEALLVLINMEGPVLLEMLREVNCPQP